MKKLRGKFALKLLAAVLCVAAGTGAVLCGLYTVCFEGSLFGNGYFSSAGYYDLLHSYTNTVGELLDLTVQTGGEAPYMVAQTMENLSNQLDPETTNFRFVVRDPQNGTILYDNTDGQSLDELEIYMPCLTTWEVNADSSAGEEFLGTEPGLESEEAVFLLPNGMVIPQTVLIEYATLYPLTYQDSFMEDCTLYEPRALYAAAALAAAAVVLAVLLCCMAGYREGTEEPCRRWADKIPYDLYLILLVLLECLSIGILQLGLNWYPQEWYYYHYTWMDFPVILAGGAALAVWFVLAGVLSTAVRVKTHTLLRNTVLWRLGAAIGRGCKRAAAALPLAWRFVLAFVSYLIVNAILALQLFTCYPPGLFLLLLLVFNGFVLLSGCRWIAQWRRIRAGTERIVGGDPGFQIDTAQMFPDLREHAEALNSLGVSVNRAVDARMQSERFKAELITNVSHDLKTPLTSIINYVDLLKKENIQDEKAQEYIEVLDRKSQRLKKLTEDLVEASKASTGTLTVNRERLSLGQLLDQAAGEYGERLEQCHLSVVTSLPEEDLYVWADGRHLWRILDNLLSNCCKYAMPGTRVYLDAEARGDTAAITMKNISREPLNVPASQLLERFVRGDASRSTEGSGLGLSIAQSLTELQGGVFSLVVDGDLFKAEVVLPRAAGLPRESVL